MSTLTDAERFLQEVFPDYTQHAIFACTTPNGMAHTRYLAGLDHNADCYWSVARFPDDLSSKRVLARALEVVALVVDDVGTKVPALDLHMALGVPTAKVRSSPGNEQWTYRLSEAIPVDQWGPFWAGADAAVGGTFDPNTKDAVHIFRLPMGLNTKKEHGGAYPVTLVELNSGVLLDVSSVARVGVARPARAASGAGGANDRLSLGALEDLIARIPEREKLDRKVWADLGHDIKALAENDADGFTAFNHLSQLWEGGYNHSYTLDKWEGFGAGGLGSKGNGLKELVQRLNPEGYREWLHEQAAAAFDDGDEPPEPPPGRGSVKFKRGEKQQILSSKDNAARALRGLGFVCRHDEFHHRVFVTRPCGKVEKLSDNLVLLLRGELEAAFGKDFGAIHIGDAIMGMALVNGFNPVVDMLRDAEANWDGVKRLDRLGPDYFHTEDTELARACVRKTMLAAVRRARSPGCKFDQILVMESPEGWDKSSAWAALAGEGNFSDAHILGKDARAVQEELADIWIHEIADLSGLNRADIEEVKAFASRVNDRARPAYGRHLVDQPRQSIEVGTTNADSYLLSTTGNRRFWTFALSARVDLVGLRRDRLQIWGEAARAESAGETLVLDPALWGLAAVEQEKRRVVDPWEDELADLPDTSIKKVLINGREHWETITSKAVYDHLGGHRGAKVSGTSAARSIAGIMKRLGWEPSNKIKDAEGKVHRGYKRPVYAPESTDADSTTEASVPKIEF